MNTLTRAKKREKQNQNLPKDSQIKRTKGNSEARVEEREAEKWYQVLRVNLIS